MSCSLTILSRCSIVFFMSSLIQGKSLFSSSFILLSNPFVLLLILACLQSSHAREFRPYVLTEPYVKVSLHTALHVNRSLKCINHFMDIPTTSVRTDQAFPCTLPSGISPMLFCTGPFPISPI